MRLTTFTAILLFLTMEAVFSAPFCVVSAVGKNCWYYDVNQCRQAAAQIRGMCVYEEEQQPTYTLPPAPVYVQPPPTNRNFVGFNIGQSAKAANEASQSLIETIQSIQEGQRRQAEHEFELRKKQEEIELLRQQQEYYKSLRERQEQPVPNSQPTYVPIQPRTPPVAEYKPEPSQALSEMDEASGIDESPTDTLWVGLLLPGGKPQVRSSGHFESQKECIDWCEKRAEGFRSSAYSFSYECRSEFESKKKKIW